MQNSQKNTGWRLLNLVIKMLFIYILAITQALFYISGRLCAHSFFTEHRTLSNDCLNK